MRYWEMMIRYMNIKLLYIVDPLYHIIFLYEYIYIYVCVYIYIIYMYYIYILYIYICNHM